MSQITTEVYKKTLGYAKKKTYSREEAEDLTQEAFLRAITKPGADVKFIYRYVVDVLAARYEVASAKKRTEVELEVPVAESLEEQYMAQERRDLVKRFLVERMDEAPPAQKHVIASVAFQWPSPQEYLYKVVGLSKPLANYHFHEAFKHFTAYAKQEGLLT